MVPTHLRGQGEVYEPLQREIEPNRIDAAIGERLHELRLLYGKSAAQVAVALNRNAEQVYEMERGERVIDRSLLPTIAGFFGLTVADLGPDAVFSMMEAQRLDECRQAAPRVTRAAVAKPTPCATHHRRKYPVPSPFALDIGQRVKAHRRARKKSQRVIAELIGTVQPIVNRMEKGQIEFSDVHLAQIAALLEVPIEELRPSNLQSAQVEITDVASEQTQTTPSETNPRDEDIEDRSGAPTAVSATTTSSPTIPNSAQAAASARPRPRRNRPVTASSRDAIGNVDRPTPRHILNVSLCDRRPGRRGRPTHLEEDRDFLRALATRIKVLRQSRGMTQADVAEAVGVSQQSVFAYENADRRPTILFIKGLARCFALSIEELLGQLPPMSHEQKSPLSPRAVLHAERFQGLSKSQQRFVIGIVSTLCRKDARQ